MKAWSLNKKISVGSAVLLLGVTVALLYNAYYVSQSVRLGLGAERDLMFQGFRGQLSQMRESEIVYNGVVQGALLQLQSRVEKKDPVTLNSQKLIEVSKGVKVPSLEVSGEDLTNNFGAVDYIKEKFGGSATIFVRNDKDFVRISTNVIKDDGSRAVGTNLSPEGPAYKALIKGESFFGQATILGKPYFTGYVPIFSKDKEVIGAWYVGFILKSLISTLEFVEKEKILTNGFITLYKVENGKAKLLVSKDNPILKDEVYVEWLDKASEENLELSDWEFTKSLEDGGYLLVSAIYKKDVSSKVINTTLASNGFMVFVILILLGGVIFFAKSLERTLSRVTSEADTVGGTVAATAGQMTLTGKKLSEGAVSAAASIEETVASLEELVSMVSRNAESAKSANGLTGDARDLTKKGEENIQLLMKAMTDIQDSSKKVSEIVAII
ncbi:MAG TPA: Cache 3/Cache 2 fusion domain-containing protein, partial [Bdellovibrio sp.]